MKPEDIFCAVIGGLSIVAGIVLWHYLSSRGCQLTAHC